MATATLSSSAIDLKSQASYTVRLGNSILKSSETKRYTSVRYNHKPSLDRPKEARYSLHPVRTNGDTGKEVLRLKDQREEYSYRGRNVSSGNCYVLVANARSSNKEWMLERLDGCHEFNLFRQKHDPNSAKLMAQFPQLSIKQEQDDDLFGDEEDPEKPRDPSDPWDYRNYLQPSAPKSKDYSALPPKPLATTVDPPSRAASTTPLSRPAKQSNGPLIAQKKRKAADIAKPNPKRVKAGTEPPAPVSTRPRAATDVPKVKIDRKASVRRASYDDSGELVLENETPISEKAPKQPSAMSLALSGQLGQGPISLHSAASSPASKIASPMPSRPEGMEEGEEFEFGEGSSPEPPAKHALQAPAEDDGDADEEDEDADADADADVEDFELPSPAQVHRKSVSAATIMGGDDDDDLDKQLALAMAEEDEGSVVAAPRVDESDEESEEE